MKNGEVVRRVTKEIELLSAWLNVMLKNDERTAEEWKWLLEEVKSDLAKILGWDEKRPLRAEIEIRQDERKRIIWNLFLSKGKVDVFEIAELVKSDEDETGLAEAARIMQELENEGLIKIDGGERGNGK